MEELKTEILEPTIDGLAVAVDALLRGEVVAIPTETVYGLAGIVFQPETVAKIFAAKERPSFDPLISHLPPPPSGSKATLEYLEASGLVDSRPMHPNARTAANALMARFWPGPLTLVLPKRERVPLLATSGLMTVGVRMPAHPLTQKLLRTVGTPLVAPSANRFGSISPTSAQDVFSELKGRIPFILDGGRCSVGIESTIVGFAPTGEAGLLRPGGISLEELRECLGYEPKRLSAVADGGLVAPGNILSHYAPKKPLALLAGPAASNPIHWPGHGPIGVLTATGSPAPLARELSEKLGRQVQVQSLSESGDLGEMARNLFSALRALDESPAVALFAEPCPTSTGLGYAINDRLSRAAARR